MIFFYIFVLNISCAVESHLCTHWNWYVMVQVSKTLNQYYHLEWFGLSTMDSKFLGPNLAKGGIQLMALWCFMSQSLSISPLHHLSMT